MDKLNEVLTNLQCELVAERNRNNPKDINWLQYDILNLINSKTTILPSEISVSLEISRTKLSKALKELKIMKYIQQQPNEKDGRELITSLTKDGKELLIHIENSHLHLYQVANSEFDDKEKEIFLNLSERYLIALRLERLRYHE